MIIIMMMMMMTNKQFYKQTGAALCVLRRAGPSLGNLWMRRAAVITSLTPTHPSKAGTGVLRKAFPCRRQTLRPGPRRWKKLEESESLQVFVIKKGLESPVFVFGNRQCNWDPRCWECVQIYIYIYGEDYLTSVRAANLLKTGLAVNVSRTSHGRRNRRGGGGGGGTCATHLWCLFLYPLFKNISNPKMSTNPPVPFHSPPPLHLPTQSNRKSFLRACIRYTLLRD